MPCFVAYLFIFFCHFFYSAQPYPPTGLSHRFECNNLDNCISQELANGSTLITCMCPSYDLLLRWDNVSGMFDVQHYLVNISGNITHVNTTSSTVRVMPKTDYLVFISTVSKCQQTSSPATINNGTVRAGKLYACRYKSKVYLKMLSKPTSLYSVCFTRTSHLITYSALQYTFAYVSTAQCTMELRI